uniref:Protein-export membrane protein SecG n=1 Tax=Globodera pallida TaxID=36090 RepID=A0A183BWA0_GLOPA
MCPIFLVIICVLLGTSAVDSQQEQPEPTDHHRHFGDQSNVTASRGARKMQWSITTATAFAVAVVMLIAS